MSDLDNFTLISAKRKLRRLDRRSSISTSDSSLAPSPHFKVFSLSSVHLASTTLCLSAYPAPPRLSPSIFQPLSTLSPLFFKIASTMVTAPDAYKNVLIIGLGLSGTHALESLNKSLPTSHRIIAISPIPGYWPIAALRASVVPVSSINASV